VTGITAGAQKRHRKLPSGTQKASEETKPLTAVSLRYIVAAKG
jgi:hypothetical protein